MAESEAAAAAVAPPGTAPPPRTSSPAPASDAELEQVAAAAAAAEAAAAPAPASVSAPAVGAQGAELGSSGSAAQAAQTPAAPPKTPPKTPPAASRSPAKLHTAASLSPPSATSSPSRRSKRSALAARARAKPLPPTPAGSASAETSPAPSAASASAGASAGAGAGAAAVGTLAGPASIPLAAPIAAPLPAIDHLIHRCASVADLQQAIKTFTALGFTVLEGGQHADGLSRNALIVFADGSYLEFIAFEDEPTNADGTPQRSHHARSASAGSGAGSWLSTFRRDKNASTAVDAKSGVAEKPEHARGKEKEAINEKESAPGRPADESKNAFLERRSRHWWWDTPAKGWIDFCFTTGVAPASQKREFVAEAKRGGPHRTPSLHRTAIVNANAANAAAAAAKQAASASPTLSKPMPALPRPLPEAGAANTLHRRAGGTLSGSAEAGSPLLGEATSEPEELEPVAYDQPRELGRRTKDGNDLRFEVIFPLSVRRRVPFFCEDITPRHLRVPPSASRHQNGSTGLSAVTLLYATPASFQQALSVLCPLLGVSSLSKVLHTHPAISSTTFDLRIRTPSSLTPTSLGSSSKAGSTSAAADGAKPLSPSLANIGRRGSGAGRPMSSDGPAETPDTSFESAAAAAATSDLSSSLLLPLPLPPHTIPLHIRVAQDVQERAHVAAYGEGVYEVEIFVAADRLPPMAPPDGIERTTAALGYGRVRLHPVFVSMLPVHAQVQSGFGVAAGSATAVAAGPAPPRPAVSVAATATATAAPPLKQATV